MKIINNYANFGCGPIYSDLGFDNYDYYDIPGKINKIDLTRPLNIPTESYEVCYTSHSLEHLSYNKAIGFLKEIHRILKPQGIVRIVVPDFELLVKEYILKLESARISNLKKEKNLKIKTSLQFIVDLILDDLTKEENQGIKRQRLNSGYYDSEYVKEISNEDLVTQKEFLSRSKIILRKIRTLINSPNKLRLLKQKLLPTFFKDPRKNGYAHKWMWDEMQLFYVLKDIGFISIKRHNFNTSDISDWHKFKLDLNHENRPLHPLSLYIEASK